MIFKTYNEALKYLEDIANTNIEFCHHEIVEDSYEYPLGLTLIGYNDSSHDQEIGFVSVGYEQ